jgi:hypothetical protein
MINETNIFERGVLISLHIGSYEGRKKLNSEQLKGLPTEIVRGVHDLFDKKFKLLLREIDLFDSQTRGNIKDRTISFFIDGVYFLKSELIDEVVEYLEKRKEERLELIQTAVNAYDGAIMDFKQEYPDFYKAAKGRYISKGDFQNRFYFNYQFLKIAPPDKDGILTPETYKREMGKFRESIEEMKKEVLSMIFENLLDATKRLKDQCTDGKPNQRTLNNLNKFLAQIDNVYSDFIDRKDIKEAIANVKANLLGVDAKSLRESGDYKAQFKKEIASAVEIIKALPDIPLKRSLEF